MLDMGIISEEEGLSQILTRLDTEEEKELARKSFAHWHEYNMYHKEGMEELAVSYTHLDVYKRQGI